MIRESRSEKNSSGNSSNMEYLSSVFGSSGQAHVDEKPVTGGGLSENGKFSYGYASSVGKRSSMEDFYETRIDGVDGEIIGLFGVFDGHGGARAAEYVKQNLFRNLVKHPKFKSDTKSAIADAYNNTDSDFLDSDKNQNRDAGSTASTAIIVGDRLVVANVGDSRVVMCKNGKAVALSRDHKPDHEDERQRIEDAGGFVVWAGTWRVGGVLAVSRAFGDKLLKQYVVADPAIQVDFIVCFYLFSSRWSLHFFSFSFVGRGMVTSIITNCHQFIRVIHRRKRWTAPLNSLLSLVMDYGTLCPMRKLSRWSNPSMTRNKQQRD